MADLLVTGVLHTLDPLQPRAAAALIRDGVFALVGTRDACAAAAGPDTRLISLDEQGCAVPGLADAHGHLFHFGRALADVDLAGCRSEAECIARVAERARETPRGAWIRGGNWDQTLWPGRAFPTLDALSVAVPDHPVALARIDLHALWANARALAACGISRDTQDPPGGKLLRGGSNVPTGLFLDNAGELVTSRIPPPRPEQREAQVMRAARAVVQLGITNVHDACVGPELGEALRRLALRGELPIRVSAMLDGQITASDAQLDEQMRLWAQTPHVGRLSVRAVKLFADGALGSRGAALLEPYDDDSGNTGLWITPPRFLSERIAHVARAGYQPAVHAIGDAACRAVLRAFEGLARAGHASLRPRVEHLQILLAEDAPLLRAAGAVASMQPTHATSDGRWAEERLGSGTARQRGAYAWRQAVDAGAVLAFGSDFPVEGPDPRAGLYSAVARRLSGAPSDSLAWMPDQRLSRLEALRAFTTGAAYAEHAEHRRGMIRAGFDADLTLFGRDYFTVPEPEIPRLPIAGTIVAGRVEYLA